MKTITGNEPAMPLNLLEYEGEIHSNADISYECEGLSIRQQFAAMAMQAIISKHGIIANNQRTVAISAVVYADALINELNKER